jgi:hypothetical protein
MHKRRSPRRRTAPAPPRNCRCPSASPARRRHVRRAPTGCTAVLGCAPQKSRPVPPRDARQILPRFASESRRHWRGIACAATRWPSTAWWRTGACGRDYGTAEVRAFPSGTAWVIDKIPFLIAPPSANNLDSDDLSKPNRRGPIANVGYIECPVGTKRHASRHAATSDECQPGSGFTSHAIAVTFGANSSEDRTALAG